MENSPFPIEKSPNEGKKILKSKESINPPVLSKWRTVFRRIGFLILWASIYFAIFEIDWKALSNKYLQNKKSTNSSQKAGLRFSPPSQAERKRREILLASVDLPRKYWSPGAKLELIWIDAGQTRLGSPRSEKGRNENEGPLTQAHFSSGFWIGKTEVTQESFKNVMGFNTIPAQSDNPFIPVNRVSWTEAMEYCSILNQKEVEAGRLPVGLEFRLPTEAEWEYVCRAGSITPYSISWDFKSPPPFWTFEVLLKIPTLSGPFEIMSSQPNPWGIYDMHGNLAEWTLDVYSQHTGKEQWDSLNYEGIDPGLRTVKGGHFKEFAEKSRSAARKAELLSAKKETLGFRVLLGVPVIADDPLKTLKSVKSVNTEKQEVQ